MERKNLITFSIYGLVVMSHISEEINVIAFKRDGKHTMHFIAPLVYKHKQLKAMNLLNADYLSQK